MSNEDYVYVSPTGDRRPEEVGKDYAATVDTTGMSEADLIAAMLAESDEWSDNPREQAEYLIGLKEGFGI